MQIHLALRKTLNSEDECSTLTLGYFSILSFFIVFFCISQQFILDNVRHPKLIINIYPFL